MAFTKDIARHDFIQIDGTDCSNSFRSFGFASEHSDEDVSGFSATGNDETLPGSTAQAFEGEAYYTPELYAVLYSLHAGRETFEVVWQPDGLSNASREVYHGNVTLNSFNPTAQRGSVRVMTCRFPAADADGIVASAAT